MKRAAHAPFASFQLSALPLEAVEQHGIRCLTLLTRGGGGHATLTSDRPVGTPRWAEKGTWAFRSPIFTSRFPRLLNPHCSDDELRSWTPDLVPESDKRRRGRGQATSSHQTRFQFAKLPGTSAGADLNFHLFHHPR